MVQGQRSAVSHQQSGLSPCSMQFAGNWQLCAACCYAGCGCASIVRLPDYCCLSCLCRGLGRWRWQARLRWTRRTACGRQHGLQSLPERLRGHLPNLECRAITRWQWRLQPKHLPAILRPTKFHPTKLHFALRTVVARTIIVVAAPAHRSGPVRLRICFRFLIF
jgi:hypothetical protein